MRKLFLLIVVLALAAAACSNSSGQLMASVGDTDITVGDVAALYESDSLPIGSELRDGIFRVVAREVLLQGLTGDFGVALDQEGVDALYAELVAQIEANGTTPADALGVPNAGFGMILFNAEIGIIREQAIEGVVALPETLETYFSDPLAYTTVCARHILVATEDEATDVLTRLDGGEDFAVIAADVSLDSPTGDLGCSVAARYVTEFADATMTAELGEFTGPVETQFGFHVLVVDERTAPTEEQVASDPLSYLSESELNTLWTQWLNEKLSGADVTVEPKYGEWTDVGIVPPEDAGS